MKLSADVYLLLFFLVVAIAVVINELGIGLGWFAFVTLVPLAWWLLNKAFQKQNPSA